MKKGEKKKASGGDGGGDDSSSSSNASKSSRSVPTFVGGVSKHRYDGAYNKDKPKSKLKLDVTQFPELLERTPWVKYAIEARSSLLAPQGMSQLLQPNFVPIEKHESSFHQDDMHFYAMLNKSVKCTVGLEFLMEEADTLSGQRVWKKLERQFDNLYSVNSMRYSDVDLDIDGSKFDAQLEAHQTSVEESFFIPRFLSQESKPPHKSELKKPDTAPPKPAVTFAASSIPKSVNKSTNDDTSQAGSTAQLDIGYHDAVSSDGRPIKLLAPSSPAAPVPNSVAYAESSILNRWKDEFSNDSNDGVSEISEGEYIRYGINATKTSDVYDDSISYRVSKSVSRRGKGDLMDRGANGGVKGSGLRTISVVPHEFVNLTGIDNTHALQD